MMIMSRSGWKLHQEYGLRISPGAATVGFDAAVAREEAVTTGQQGGVGRST